MTHDTQTRTQGCGLTDPHDCATVRAANSALRRHLSRACDARDEAMAALREALAWEEATRARLGLPQIDAPAWTVAARAAIESAGRLG